MVTFGRVVFARTTRIRLFSEGEHAVVLADVELVFVDPTLVLVVEREAATVLVVEDEPAVVDAEDEEGRVEVDTDVD